METSEAANLTALRLPGKLDTELGNYHAACSAAFFNKKLACNGLRDCFVAAKSARPPAWELDAVFEGSERPPKRTHCLV